MEKIRNENVLLVKQIKEWGEILTGFETKNKYKISNTSGTQLYFAAEKSSFLARLFLKNLRPYTMHIIDSDEKVVLKLKRPFRWFFAEMQIMDAQDRMLGMIQLKFALFSRQLMVKDTASQLLYMIYGPLFHPWTFRIMENDQEKGKISKKWSGLGKEMFSDADNFNIEFPANIDLNKKNILLGALFLIDMLYFENK